MATLTLTIEQITAGSIESCCLGWDEFPRPGNYIEFLTVAGHCFYTRIESVRAVPDKSNLLNLTLIPVSGRIDIQIVSATQLSQPDYFKSQVLNREAKVPVPMGEVQLDLALCGQSVALDAQCSDLLTTILGALHSADQVSLVVDTQGLDYSGLVVKRRVLGSDFQLSLQDVGLQYFVECVIEGLPKPSQAEASQVLMQLVPPTADFIPIQYFVEHPALKAHPLSAMILHQLYLFHVHQLFASAPEQALSLSAFSGTCVLDLSALPGDLKLVAYEGLLRFIQASTLPKSTWVVLVSPEINSEMTHQFLKKSPCRTVLWTAALPQWQADVTDSFKCCRQLGETGLEVSGKLTDAFSLFLSDAMLRNTILQTPAEPSIVAPDDPHDISAEDKTILPMSQVYKLHEEEPALLFSPDLDADIAPQGSPLPVESTGVEAVTPPAESIAAKFSGEMAGAATEHPGLAYSLGESHQLAEEDDWSDEPPMFNMAYFLNKASEAKFDLSEEEKKPSAELVSEATAAPLSSQLLSQENDLLAVSSLDSFEESPSDNTEGTMWGMDERSTQPLHEERPMDLVPLQMPAADTVITWDLHENPEMGALPQQAEVFSSLKHSLDDDGIQAPLPERKEAIVWRPENLEPDAALDFSETESSLWARNTDTFDDLSQSSEQRAFGLVEPPMFQMEASDDASTPLHVLKSPEEETALPEIPVFTLDNGNVVDTTEPPAQSLAWQDPIEGKETLKTGEMAALSDEMAFPSLLVEEDVEEEADLLTRLEGSVFGEEAAEAENHFELTVDDAERESIESQLGIHRLTESHWEASEDPASQMDMDAAFEASLLQPSHEVGSVENQPKKEPLEQLQWDSSDEENPLPSFEHVSHSVPKEETIDFSENPSRASSLAPLSEEIMEEKAGASYPEMPKAPEVKTPIDLTESMFEETPEKGPELEMNALEAPKTEMSVEEWDFEFSETSESGQWEESPYLISPPGLTIEEQPEASLLPKQQPLTAVEASVGQDIDLSEEPLMVEKDPLEDWAFDMPDLDLSSPELFEPQAGSSTSHTDAQAEKTERPFPHQEELAYLIPDFSLDVESFSDDVTSEAAAPSEMQDPTRPVEIHQYTSENPSPQYEPGQQVNHQRYGHGVIKRVITLDEEQVILNINFDGIGKRLLDPRLTPLEKVS